MAEDRVIVEINTMWMLFFLVFLFLAISGILGYLWITRESRNEGRAKKDRKVVKQNGEKNPPGVHSTGVVALDPRYILFERGETLGGADIRRRNFPNPVDWHEQLNPAQEDHHRGATVEKPVADDTSAVVTKNGHSHKFDGRNHCLPNNFRRGIEANKGAFTHKCASHQLEKAVTFSQDTDKKTAPIRREATERKEAKIPIKSEDDDIPAIDQHKVTFKRGVPEIQDSKPDVSDGEDTQTDEGYGSEEGLETPPDDHPNAREVDWTAHTKLRMMTHNRLTPRQEESDIDSAFNSDSEPDGEYITEIIAAKAKTRKNNLHRPNYNGVLRDMMTLQDYATDSRIEKKIHEDDVYNFILQHEKESVAPAALNVTVGAIPFEICGECKSNFHSGLCVECWMGLCEDCAFQHRCRHELRKTF